MSATMTSSTTTSSARLLRVDLPAAGLRRGCFSTTGGGAMTVMV